jgi:hypothetical protein
MTDTTRLDEMSQLIDSWQADEWPAPLDRETLRMVNDVAPPSYGYEIVYNASETRVNLRRYVGAVETVEPDTEGDDE